MGEIKYINFTNGNNASALINTKNSEIGKIAKVIDLPLPKRRKVPRSGKKADSDSTVDPIRDPEHLRAFRRYFHDKYLKTKNLRMKKLYLSKHLLFMLGTNTALRVSDLFRITWEELLSEDKFIIKEKKTGKKTKKYINSDLLEAIQEYVSFYNTNNYEYNLNDTVFFGVGKDKVSEKEYQNAIKAYSKLLKGVAVKIGIKDNIATHSMRKTFAYWFLMDHKGDSRALTLLMKLLNHSSIAVTLFYAGFSDDETKGFYTDMSKLYKSIDKGTVKIYDDKITVSRGQVEELLRYAYSLGKEPITDFNTDVDNLTTLNGMLADLEL